MIRKTREKGKSLAWLLWILMVLFLLLTGCKKKENMISQPPKESKDVAQDGEAAKDKESDEEAEKTKNISKNDLKPDTTVMSVGNVSITYQEILFYIYQLKGQYEPSVGDGVWQYEYLEGKTFGDYAKEEIIRQITELQVICQQAKSQNIVLTDDELQEVRDLASDFMVNAEKNIAAYGITQALVEKVYADNVLANKMFDITTGEVDTSIPDEEAKQVTIEYLVVLTKGTNKDGKKVDMTQKERAAAKKKAKALQKEAKSAESFYLFAEANSDAETVRVTYGTDNMPKEFGEQGMKMKTGKISGVIEGNDGYYILYCKSDFDEEATMQKKEDIISQRQSKVFENAYTEWSRKYEVSIRTKIWEKISFSLET